MPRTKKKQSPTKTKRRPAAQPRPATRLEDRTRIELYEMAHRLDIAGSAEMSKSELLEAIRRR